MRILIAHSFYRASGGEDGYVQGQVRLLSPHHDVALLDARNADLTAGLDTAARMTWSPKIRRAAEQHMADFRPEVVHLHNAYPGLGPAVHVAARHRRVPLVMTVHNLRLRCPNGIMFTDNSQCRRCEAGAYANAILHKCLPSLRQATTYAGALWLHRFVFNLEAMVRIFIAPSRFMHEKLRSWGIPEHKVVTVRNFTPPAAGKMELGQAGVYLGRLASEKGVFDLLNALRLAGDPPFRIVGEGPLSESLRHAGIDMGLARTEFTGLLTREGVQAVLQDARFVVVPSRWEENAPLAAMEAMAAGRPLVVTRAGGLPELVENGAGLSYEVGDVSGIATGINHFMSNDSLCLSAGQQGREFASKHLHPDVHRQELERAYALATE